MDIKNRIEGEVYFVTVCRKWGLREGKLDWNKEYSGLQILSFRIYPSLNKERGMPVAGICYPSLLYYKDLQSDKCKY